jgi:uncharacterized paraquat-inducible protein A
MAWCRGKVQSLVVTVQAAVLLVPAWFAPCFTLVPRLGDTLTIYLALYFPYEMEPEPVTLAGGITLLLSHGGRVNFGIGILLLAFTVVFPVVKLLVLLTLCLTDPATFGRHRRYFHRFLHNSGKWSMLDVWVLAGLVITLKQFTFGSIRPECGLLVLAAAVILTNVAAVLVKRAEDEE